MELEGYQGVLMVDWDLLHELTQMGKLQQCFGGFLWRLLPNRKLNLGAICVSYEFVKYYSDGLIVSLNKVITLWGFC